MPHSRLISSKPSLQFIFPTALQSGHYCFGHCPVWQMGMKRFENCQVHSLVNDRADFRFRSEFQSTRLMAFIFWSLLLLSADFILIQSTYGLSLAPPWDCLHIHLTVCCSACSYLSFQVFEPAAAFSLSGQCPHAVSPHPS